AGRHQRHGHRSILDPPDQIIGLQPEPAVATVLARMAVVIAVDHRGAVVVGDVSGRGLGGGGLVRRRFGRDLELLWRAPRLAGAWAGAFGPARAPAPPRSPAGWGAGPAGPEGRPGEAGGRDVGQATGPPTVTGAFPGTGAGQPTEPAGVGRPDCISGRGLAAG